MEVPARPACEAGAVQPRSWGWGSGSGDVPWPEGAAPVQLPFSRWVFCSLSLSFLFWAHTLHGFTAQRVQQKSLFPFPARLPPAFARFQVSSSREVQLTVCVRIPVLM